MATNNATAPLADQLRFPPPPPVQLLHRNRQFLGPEGARDREAVVGWLRRHLPKSLPTLRHFEEDFVVDPRRTTPRALSALWWTDCWPHPTAILYYTVMC